MAFVAYATYALSDASIKLLHGTLDPFEVMFIAAAMGTLAIPALKQRTDEWRDLFRSRRRALWLMRAAAAASGALASIVAFTRLPMAEAFAIIFLLPALVTVLSVLFLGETIGWRRWSAVAVGFIGVLVVLRPGFRALGIGHLAAFLSGMSGAVTIVILRALGGGEKRISLYGAGLAGPLVVSFVMMLPHVIMPNGRQWLWLAGCGLMGTCGNIMIQLASRNAPASLVAPTQYSQMLWAILLGYAVFHDRPDGWMYVGAAIIVASGLFTFSREKKKTRWWRTTPPVHPQ
ncbi:DMT family transporter [Lichenicoccus sp.]|uniref:DMT family transporter n=1 Tax=Lichenicoccus sp. TaxID=2781899 RepID=UPI003D0B2FBF